MESKELTEVLQLHTDLLIFILGHMVALDPSISTGRKSTFLETLKENIAKSEMSQAARDMANRLIEAAEQSYKIALLPESPNEKLMN